MLDTLKGSLLGFDMRIWKKALKYPLLWIHFHLVPLFSYSSITKTIQARSLIFHIFTLMDTGQSNFITTIKTKMSHYFKKRTNHFPFYQKPHSFRWFTEPKRTRKYLNFKLIVDKKVVFVVFIYEVISEFSEFIYEVISN